MSLFGYSGDIRLGFDYLHRGMASKDTIAGVLSATTFLSHCMFTEALIGMIINFFKI